MKNKTTDFIGQLLYGHRWDPQPRQKHFKVTCCCTDTPSLVAEVETRAA